MILHTVQEKIHEFREMKKSTLGVKRAKDITDICSQLLQIIFDLHDEECDKVQDIKDKSHFEGYVRGYEDAKITYEDIIQKMKDLLSNI